MNTEVDRGEVRPVLEARTLSKRFGREAALDGVSFQMAAGEVVGLVGPNGAGKSTLMRIVCRLVRPTTGTVQIGGFGLDSDPGEYLAQVGALIDAPGLYPYLTARQHLTFIRRIRGVRPEPVVTELLDMVGLAGAEGKIAKHFSMGMRQRLCLAMAVAHAPRLLVLDEPMNGLDPSGTRDLRTFIGGLAAGGVSVLLSSHLLSEVEQVCGRVLMLNRGRLVSDTVPASSSGTHATGVLIGTTANERAIGVLQGAGFAASMGGAAVVCEVPRERLIELAPLLVAAGIGLTELREARPTLESQYLDAIEGATAAVPRG